jgi:hypothetical protein
MGYGRDIIYRSIDQSPSSPLNIIKNHPKTFPAVGSTIEMDGPKSQPIP